MSGRRRSTTIPHLTTITRRPSTRPADVAEGEVWVIANPKAGGGRGSRHASVATRALHDARIPSRLVHPSSVQATVSVAREAVASGARAVVACGGDGTVHGVVQALARTSVPLGVVAGGSGDDIATALGFPSGDADECAAALLRGVRAGEPRQLDLGVVRTADGVTEYFLGVLSTGFDSSVNERANSMSRLGKQRYNIAIVRELASFRPVDYDVTMDDRRIEGPGMLVSVGNTSSYGGGMRLCPDAVPDDGELDVTWLSAVSTLTFLRVFPSVFSGEHVRHPAVSTYRARRLEISAPGQIAYADGERIGPLPVTIEIEPGALCVLSC
ncbi:MAG: YegS/Rv2252/BmrU family lipid kinase [Actinobacteria bacterium]|nr:YegS/Rv2252/BmrU family lipid kinase [Actinomycetota bacterium]